MIAQKNATNKYTGKKNNVQPLDWFVRQNYGYLIILWVNTKNWFNYLGNAKRAYIHTGDIDKYVYISETHLLYMVSSFYPSEKQMESVILYLLTFFDK